MPLPAHKWETFQGSRLPLRGQVVNGLVCSKGKKMAEDIFCLSPHEIVAI